MARLRRLGIILLIGTFLPFHSLFAAPPFITYDPYPQDYHTVSNFLFATLNHTNEGTVWAFPAVEIDYGLYPNIELNTIIPFYQKTTQQEEEQSPAGGFGDIQLGMKFRFIQETETHPQVSFVPILFIPTGNQSKGLGNGKAWYQFPIAAQKSWGQWTSYASAGYALNPGQGMRNFLFAGWQAQRTINETWTFGGEIFSQGPNEIDQTSSTLLNVGGYYNLYPNLSIPFSIGHSILGQNTLVAYVAINWVAG